jgi:hypothetical protein
MPAADRRGSVALRTALYQAASMARLHEPRLAEIYHHKHQLHKHHSVAISHVARKLLAIIYAVCARGQSYDPSAYDFPIPTEAGHDNIAVFRPLPRSIQT